MTTYLLGAGASAECVPVVEDFRSTFRNIVKIGALVKGMKNAGFMDEIENLKLSFATYYSIIRQHPTIDIFAKKLYVKNSKTTRKDLRLLKQKLVLYFNFLQYSRPIDDRYTRFFASIIAPKRKFILPKDINIIAWNYDFQLELAVSDFLVPKDKNIDNIHRILKIYPSPYHQVEFEDYNKDFTITKLNGSCNMNRRMGTNSHRRPFA